MRTKNFPEKQNQRRMGAMFRLEEQLKSGYKIVKSRPSGMFGTMELSEQDRKRIKKEIDILDKRVVSSARDRRSKKVKG